MTSLSRRKLLAAGAGTFGAAVAGSLLPPSVHQALALPTPRGGLHAIKHVVVLMQENRSFDHYFGSLRGVAGFQDRNALTLPGGGSVFQQPGGAAPVLPFSVREAARDSSRPGSAIHYIGDLDHSWDGGHRAWSNGWLDNWVGAKSAATMAYYDRTDLPFHYELADTFTLCDAYHCSEFGPTNPNRMYLMSGKVGFEPPPNQHKRAISNDAYSEDTHAGYDWTTYPERLERAGVSWRIYQEWDNYQDNALEFFTRFKQIARKALAPAGDFRSLDTFYGKVREAAEPERARLLGLLEQGVRTLTEAERRLYDKGLRRTPTGTLAADFRTDVAAGRLPRVSYLVPSAVDSEHPGASSPAASASITYQVLDALASNPEVWSSTALILTYDENDGYFDHVPPPVPAPDTAEEFYQGKPMGLGFRVPTVVVSPWTVGGAVCSEVFDHTSVLRFLETWLGVREDNISSWRRTVAGDLTGVFDFDGCAPGQQLTPPAPTPAALPRWRPVPPAQQHLPAQEPGHRPARPLPYQPNADCRIDVNSRTVTLVLSNAGRSSAHLAVYPYAGEFDAPRHYEVRGWRTDAYALKSDKYRLTVLGPNGFRREFAGALAGVGAEVSTEIESRRRQLRITLTNTGDTVLTFELREGPGQSGTRRRVRVPGRQSRTVNSSAAADHGWYDLTVQVVGDKEFSRRLAGHIENGRPSTKG